MRFAFRSIRPALDPSEQAFTPRPVTVYAKDAVRARGAFPTPGGLNKRWYKVVHIRENEYV
jgi:hypothetical protein